MLILINNDVLTSISQCVNLSPDAEVGGILLGKRRGPHIHVTLATRPGPKDRSSRFKFIRKCMSHQLAATKQWIQSGRTSDWVGDWHSHPESNPSPSMVDLRSWRTLSKSHQANMVVVISGQTTLWAGICDKRGSIQELTLKDKDPVGLTYYKKTNSFL